MCGYFRVFNNQYNAMKTIKTNKAKKHMCLEPPCAIIAFSLPMVPFKEAVAVENWSPYGGAKCAYSNPIDCIIVKTSQLERVAVHLRHTILSKSLLWLLTSSWMSSAMDLIVATFKPSARETVESLPPADSFVFARLD